MRTMIEPFALQIFRRYREGETVPRLAAELGIPADRIRQRLRAAAVYSIRRSPRGSNPSPVLR